MEVIGYWNFNFNISWFFRLCRLISAGMFSNLYSTGPFVGLTLPFMIRPFLIRYDQLSTMKKRMEPKILSSMNNYNLHLLLTFLLKRLWVVDIKLYFKNFKGGGVAELKPGGENIPVTRSNVLEYIMLFVENRLLGNHIKCLEAIRKGRKYHVVFEARNFFWEIIQFRRFRCCPTRNYCSS